MIYSRSKETLHTSVGYFKVKSKFKTLKIDIHKKPWCDCNREAWIYHNYALLHGLESRLKTPTASDNTKKSIGHQSFGKTQSDADQDWKKFMLKKKQQLSLSKTEVKMETD